MSRTRWQALWRRTSPPTRRINTFGQQEAKKYRRNSSWQGLKLSAVQNHFSLINRSSEDSGILDYCKENGVTRTQHVEDAVKAANVTLTAEETAELEKLADSLELNVIRFWEKEMK